MGEDGDVPSDTVAVALALSAPTVAGIVAVVIHQGRLRHERVMHDLERLRDTLADGAQMLARHRLAALLAVEGFRLDGTAYSWEEALGDLIDVKAEAAAFRARLLLWVGRNDRLIAGLAKIADELSGITRSNDVAQRRAHFESLGERINDWYDLASEVTKTRT